MYGLIPNHRLRDAIASELLDGSEASEALTPAAVSVSPTRVGDVTDTVEGLNASNAASAADATDRSDDVDLLTGGGE